ncbi:MAG TPA: TIGR00730 family Rossman fold protein [Enteractinococcus helveticum]|uniref:Cytokinin riboside 5'-monophosphate phosphoribohydrolase n=1 Tax=Enteractinococcus helveticum TaxID=1837282 RepID=A0A921FNL5_9MICC|nr:TIGR00730 family Rossman fold protein [Enteractinococcus helveticum]HJF14607.1 TIGR00730 family Rossman fold protein [Enteractinococcus helveticum]
MTKRRQIHRITVFTGSRHGNSDAYVQAVESFAGTLADHGYGLVFGGGNVGLMGVLADTVLASGGEVTGIMPESLTTQEIPHPHLTSLEIVPNMHIRKERMADLGDAFVALPGGAGTLEELFEAWTWQQLGIHTKPVALLNVAGFWDPLLAMLDHMAAAGFMRTEFTNALIVESDPAALLAALASWQPPKHPWKDPHMS